HKLPAAGFGNLPFTAQKLFDDSVTVGSFQRRIDAVDRAGPQRTCMPPIAEMRRPEMGFYCRFISAVQTRRPQGMVFIDHALPAGSNLMMHRHGRNEL